jgi:3-methyladenine DNA glycosylase/8-oxoguanine DNA glycosylase
LRPVRLGIPVGRFDLGLVVRSHGWYDLPPFSWDAAAGRLQFVFLESEFPVRVVVSKRTSGLRATASSVAPSARASKGASSGGAPQEADLPRRAHRAGPRQSPFEGPASSNLPSRAALLEVLRRVFDLTADLSAFHALCRDRAADGFGWIAERGAGRILRAPTLFEDAVKVLATTNCTWALTKAMVGNLVAAFGRGGAFPTPSFVAGLRVRELSALKFGYRAPYLAAFAGRVASGKLDLSRWEDASRPDAEIEREIRAEKGFGPYAADTLGRLLGRHARLGLDAWSRKKVAQLRFRGRAGKDARVERFYRPFGPHAGLAFWLDVTRDWHEGAEGPWP